MLTLTSRAGPDGCVIAALRGGLDLAFVPALRERLLGLLRPGASRLIVDLSAVGYADASGLAVLVGAGRRAGLLGGWLRLASPTPDVARVLSATGLERHLATFPTVADAIIGRRPEAGPADAGTGTAGHVAPVRPAAALPAGPPRAEAVDREVRYVQCVSTTMSWAVSWPFGLIQECRSAMTATTGDEAVDAQFRHLAVFYETGQDYLDQVGGFIRRGLAAGEPLLVAIPDARLRMLRRALDGAADAVTFTDMQDLGRNPARIIPAVRRFTDAHPGRTRFVGEPIWAGRTTAETREAARHEALINAAFRGVPTTILCPYDRAGLASQTLDRARETHPQIAAQGKPRPSQAYSGIDLALTIGGERQSPAPANSAVLNYQRGNLPLVRRFTRDHASRAGLAGQGRDDLVIAVHELAANTIAHADGHGTLRIWTEQDRLVCEVTDSGHISDPLAGRHLSGPQEGGHGLSLVHQVCDLVEVRSGSFGTNIRAYRDLT